MSFRYACGMVAGGGAGPRESGTLFVSCTPLPQPPRPMAAASRMAPWMTRERRRCMVRRTPALPMSSRRRRILRGRLPVGERVVVDRARVDGRFEPLELVVGDGVGVLGSGVALRAHVLD